MAKIYPFRSCAFFQAFLVALAFSPVSAEQTGDGLQGRNHIPLSRLRLSRRAFIRKTGFSFLICLSFYGCPNPDAQAAGTPIDPPAGIGLFGPITIHTDTLAVWGDLVLENVHLNGRGVLALIGSKPQHIVSHDSRIDNLALLNPNRVMLHGHLVIENSLTIDQGRFEVEPGGLTLTDSTRIRLIRNSKLLVQKLTWSSLPTKGTTSRLPDLTYDGEMWLTGHRWQRHGSVLKPVFVQPVCYYVAVPAALRTPPPEMPTARIRPQSGAYFAWKGI